MWASWSDSLHIFTGSHGYLKLGGSGEMSLAEMGFEGRARIDECVGDRERELSEIEMCCCEGTRGRGLCFEGGHFIYSISSQQPSKNE